MRFKITSIRPAIIDVSNNEESSFIIGSTYIDYQVIMALRPILAMEVTIEMEGQPTMEEIIKFIKKTNEYYSTTPNPT